MRDLSWTDWHWDRAFSYLFGFHPSVSFHGGSSYSYITWGLNSSPVGSRSSQTLSRPIDRNMKTVRSWRAGLEAVTKKKSARHGIEPRLSSPYPFHYTDWCSRVIQRREHSWICSHGGGGGYFMYCLLRVTSRNAVSSSLWSHLQKCGRFFFKPALMDACSWNGFCLPIWGRVYMHEGWLLPPTPLLLAWGGTLISPWYMPEVSWKFTS